MKKIFVATAVLFIVGATGFYIYDRFFSDAALFNRMLNEAPSAAGNAPPPDLFDTDGVVQTQNANLPPKAVAGRNRQVNVHSDLLDLESLTLNLFDDQIFIAERDRLILHNPGNMTWIGHIRGEAESEVFLTVHGNAVSGNVQIGEIIYEIEPKQNRRHEITQVDPGKNPEHSHSIQPEGAPPSLEGDSVSTTSTPAASGASAGTVVDLMVAFTQKAKMNAGGQAGIESKIMNAVAMANQAYINSQIPMQLNLVAMVETNYVESGNMTTTITDLRGTNDGKIDELHSLRDQYGADQVALVSADTNYCGYGYIMTSGWRTTAFATYAFTVVHDDSVYACLSNNTLAHELGHNQGDQHNIEDSSVAGSFDYSYGHRLCQTGGFRTIMSYSCTGGTRVSYFSNPDVLLSNGYATGTVSANNALSMTNNKDIVAGFRASVTANPPSAPNGLQASTLSSSQIALSWIDNSGDESGFRVERSGDSGANWSEVAVVGSNIVNYDDAGLVASAAYDYRVRAYNSAGFSSYTNIATTTTESTPCSASSPLLGLTGAPQYVQPNAALALSVSLTNQDSAGCSASSFSIGTSDGGNLGTYVLSPLSSAAATWNLNAPTTDGNHTLSAMANAVGHSDATASQNIFVDGTAPTAPGSLSGAVVRKSGIKLTWAASTDSGSGMSYYQISRNGVPVGTTTQTSYIDKPGGKGGNYTYTVSAIDKAGNSVGSSVSVRY